MPRDLPVGNGNLLIAFDARYRLREIYFPYVGQANHTLGKPCRFGVWADGALSWTDDEAWQRDLRYEPDTLVTSVSLRNEELGIGLVCRDCVDFDADIFVRRIDLQNLREGKREVRLFFHQDLDIGGAGEADTAFYHPELKSLIQYKGRYWFLICASTGDSPGISSYATGLTGLHGSEGTWRDAEDGSLQRNAISQGSVDATASLKLRLIDSAVAYYWICAGENLERVRTLHQIIVDHGPERLLRRTRQYWRQWVTHGRAQRGVPDDVREFYRRSLLILRTQIDNRGAIIAANDSDTLDFSRDSYSYMWPRDGALVAHALDQAGYHDVSERFFAYCDGLQSPEGWFFHKYHPDGSLGSSWHPWVNSEGGLQLPIQEDETALVLHALWNHYQAFRDIDFIRPLYRRMVKRAGDFLCAYRDEETGLPLPSWDLWEERWGVHLFTVAAVWAGLAAASGFAEIFGDDERADRYSRTAASVKRAALGHLYDPNLGRFLRGLTLRDGALQPDQVPDSSQAGIFLFGMLSSDDPRVVETMEALRENLWCRTEVGGLARYQSDPYQAAVPASEDVPGNPWFICTLWLAEWQVARAESVEELEPPLQLLRWVTGHAAQSGVLAEQLHPLTGAPLSVSPLTWSHAAFVSAVCAWEDRYARLTSPHLPD